MGKDFEVQKDGTTLNILLGNELSVANAAKLTDELSKYCGQGIKKVVFDATGLIFLTSSGLRAVFFAYQDLGGEPEIVFVNSVQQIHDVLEHVGLASFIKFENDAEKKKEYRKNNFANLSKDEIAQITSERNQALDNFSAHNDVVCYNLKMGQEE